MNEILHGVLKEFADGTIAGIPTDVISHYIIGMCLFWWFMLFQGSRKTAFLGVLFLAVFKEMAIDNNDFSTLVGWAEPIKDVGLSCIGACTGCVFPIDAMPVVSVKRLSGFWRPRRKRIRLFPKSQFLTAMELKQLKRQ